MRSPLLWISALALSAFVFSGGAFAEQTEGSVLFVAPHRLVIGSSEQGQVISVTNKSNKLRRYDLELVDQVMGSDGITMRKDTFDYSIKRMTKFVPKRFTLEPGARQNVRVQVKRPDGMADGDYHSHLLFREVPPNVKDKQKLQEERKDAEKVVSFEIRTLYGIAVPIIVQKGVIDGSISMGEPVLGKTADGTQHMLKIDFNRGGNSEATGKVSITYVADGKEPVLAVEEQWVRIYREVGKVSKEFALSKLPADAKGGKLMISLVRDEADASKTDKQEISFN